MLNAKVGIKIHRMNRIFFPSFHSVHPFILILTDASRPEFAGLNDTHNFFLILPQNSESSDAFGVIR
jgi:hypothetical protein